MVLLLAQYIYHNFLLFFLPNFSISFISTNFIFLGQTVWPKTLAIIRYQFIQAILTLMSRSVFLLTIEDFSFAFCSELFNFFFSCFDKISQRQTGKFDKIRRQQLIIKVMLFFWESTESYLFTESYPFTPDTGRILTFLWS